MRMSQVKLVSLRRSELAIEWQQVFPEVQIGWEMKGGGDSYLSLLQVFFVVCLFVGLFVGLFVCF